MVITIIVREIIKIKIGKIHCIKNIGFLNNNLNSFLIYDFLIFNFFDFFSIIFFLFLFK